MELDNKIYNAIIFLIRVSLIIAFFFGLWYQDWIMAFASAITLILTYAHILFERRTKIMVPVELEIISVIFIYSSIFLGEVFNFYSLFPWWDLVLHTGAAIAFGFIGFMIMYVLYQGKKFEASASIIVLFAFTFAMSIGALWEVFEFFMDSVFGTNMLKSGLMDTMWDLIVNTIGAMIASIVGYIYLKRGDVFFFGESMKEFKRDNPRFFSKKIK